MALFRKSPKRSAELLDEKFFDRALRGDLVQLTLLEKVVVELGPEARHAVKAGCLAAERQYEALVTHTSRLPWIAFKRP